MTLKKKCGLWAGENDGAAATRLHGLCGERKALWREATLCLKR